MKHNDHKRLNFTLFITVVLFILSILSISGCGAPSKQIGLIKISASDYPDFTDDIYFNGLKESVLQSLSYLRRVPESRTFSFGTDSYSARHLIRSLEQFLSFIEKKPTKDQIKKFIQDHFIVYQSTGTEGSKKVLFTGYYEPEIRGSLQKTSRYFVPVYSRPDDLITIDLSAFSSRFAGESITGRLEGKRFIPYYDRRQIDLENILEGKALPLLWVDNRIDLFFLQIQGSGKVILEDGSILNIHFQDKNGLPYRSIGKYLLQQGKVSSDEMSMQKIREYLRNNPNEAQDIMNQNPSYVFFSIEPDGPLGALNVRLTPGRSIAVDRKVFPLPALVYVETQKPLVDGDSRISEWDDCRRFVISQDTGGAINGAGHVDFFWGNGTYAEIAAGHMHHNGKLYFLILKPESY